MEKKKENAHGKTIVASFVIDEELHRSVKIHAALTGKKIKDVVDEALNEYLSKRSY